MNPNVFPSEKLAIYEPEKSILQFINMENARSNAKRA